jgi:peptidoglycan/LPS O-acetylase OafA/YrhL
MGILVTDSSRGGIAPAVLEVKSNHAVIPELDGVRGIAILLVLVFHFRGPNPPSSIPQFMDTPLRLGWSGVDLFFALSGF